jgi:predicted RND superfamily exporter protein
MLELLPPWYDRLILRHPVIILLLTAIVASFFAYHARNFRLDASADSLVLKDDPALQTYRTIRARYGSDDFLVLTYAPKQNLFKQATLTELRALRDQLAHLQGVASVVSILDMPLIRSPPVTLSQLAESVPTLENPKTDKALAQKELRTSPLYRNLLISPDGTTTALKINVRSDETYSRLLHRRNELRNKRQHGALSSEERAELARVSQRFSVTNSEHQARLRKLIGEVRAIKDEYGGTTTLHLAGVPLIIADSISFIRHDLVTFGIGVLAFLIVILAVAFRKPRWIALPLLTCLSTGIIMIGFLGLLDWPVTVISANFPSLLLIVTLSLSVHLIVRYREVHAQNPQAEQVWLVREMVHSKALPCFYTAITTMVAFVHCWLATSRR